MVPRTICRWWPWAGWKEYHLLPVGSRVRVPICATKQGHRPATPAACKIQPRLLNQNARVLKIKKFEWHHVKVQRTLPAISHMLRSPEPANVCIPRATGCDCHGTQPWVPLKAGNRLKTTHRPKGQKGVSNDHKRVSKHY